MTADRLTAQRTQGNQQTVLARIGVISDTHGLFDAAIARHFAGVNHIVHAGDIGNRTVIDRLERIAPVTAVSGNVDGFEASGFPREAVVVIAGRRLALYHRLYEAGVMTADGRAFLDRVRPDICVFGHSHRPTIERRDRMLLFNPGSAGPKRFRLPRGLGLLVLSRDAIDPVQIELPDRPQSDLD
jgi:putative phosphoesterase